MYTNFDGHGLTFTNEMSDSTMGVTQTMPCFSQSIANSYSNANCSTRGMLVIELLDSVDGLLLCGEPIYLDICWQSALWKFIFFVTTSINGFQ